MPQTGEAGFKGLEEPGGALTLVKWSLPAGGLTWSLGLEFSWPTTAEQLSVRTQVTGGLFGKGLLPAWPCGAEEEGGSLL